MSFYQPHRPDKLVSRTTQTRICPGCGVLLDASDARCFQCGANLSPVTFPGARLWWKRHVNLQGQVTFGLVIVNFFMFFLTWLLTRDKSGFMMGIDLQVLNRFGAKNAALIAQGQGWRLLTAIFLHGNLLHIFFNMMALMSLGRVVEELYGWQKYLFLYTFSGTIGYVASSWFYPHVLSIGASGSIMGLAGVLIATSLKNWKLYGPVMGKSLVRWVIYILLIGFFLSGYVDNAAHIGGVVSGFLLALPFSTFRRRETAFSKAFDNVLGWGTAALIGASFAVMALTP